MPRKGEYWKFYWPLALMSVAMVIGRQVENGVLACYRDAARQLATLAFAMGVLMPFSAMLAFVPQMANVLGRSRRGRSVCLRFTLLVSVLVTLPVAAAAFTAPGRAVVARLFELDEPATAQVVRYLRLLLPLSLAGGMRQYCTGMLVQARRTGLVTTLNVLSLAALIATLLLGLHLGWGAVWTLAAGRLISAGLHLALAAGLYAAFYHPPARAEHEDLTYGQVLGFFWPVAVTGVMFAFSRPVLYAFLNRTAGGEVAVAAARVAFDFSLLFGSFANQFRHFFVTFAARDLPGVRRFMVRGAAALMGGMAVIVFTPLAGGILRGLMDIPAQIADPAAGTLQVMCLWPAVMCTRNYFHGQLLLGRRTAGMAVGGLCRVGAIYLASRLLWAAGLLDHAWAGAILVLGFAAEAVVSMLFARRLAAAPEAVLSET